MNALVPALAALLALAYAAALAGGELVPLATLRGIAAVAVVVGVAWGSGIRVLRALDRTRRGAALEARDHAAGLLLGLGALAAIGAALALVGLYRPGALIAVLVLLALPAAAALRRAGWPPARDPAAPPVLARPARVVLWAAGVATFLAALPPVSWFDALEYHAALPSLYLMEGGFVDLPNFFSRLPHLFNLAYGYGLALDPAAPVAVLHWAVGAALLVGTAALADRLVPGAGLLAAALLAGAHVVVDCATAPGVDLFVAASSVHALERVVRAGDEPDGLALAVLLCGLAVAAKLHGVLAAAGVAVALAVRRPGGRVTPARRRAAAVAVAAALLLPAPFLLRTWLRHGSPVWPFLDGTPAVAAWKDAVVAKTRVDGIDGGDLARLPGEALRTFFRRDGWTPALLAGLAAALVAGAGRRKESRAVAAFAAVVLGGWLAGARVERYALPALPALAALAAAGIASVRAAVAWRPARLLWSVAAGVPLVVSAVVVVVDVHRLRDPLAYLSGRLGAEDYLEWADERSPAAVLLRAGRELPAGAFVVSFDDPRMFHLRRRWRAATAYDPPLLRTMIGGGGGDVRPSQRLWQAVRAAGFSHVLVNPEEARFLARAFPGLPGRTLAEDDALREMLEAHGRLMFTRNGAALFALERAGPP